MAITKDDLIVYRDEKLQEKATLDIKKQEEIDTINRKYELQEIAINSEVNVLERLIEKADKEEL